MRSTRLRVAGLSLLAGFSFGCGGYNANDVTVSVSPASATVAASSQVTLHASVNGLCSGCTASIYLWYVSENEIHPPDLCTNTPPTPQCPAGTVQAAVYPSLTATYVAPSTPGTYHVIAQWYVPGIFAGSASTTKTGTSVITVGP